MDSGVAVLVFLIAAVVLYLIFKYCGIATGAAVALALFFALLIMAFVKTPMSIYSNWQTDGMAQLYGIVAALATLYIIIWFLYAAFKSRDPNVGYGFRAW